jgi:hypothetical protein
MLMRRDPKPVPVGDLVGEVDAYVGARRIDNEREANRDTDLAPFVERRAGGSSEIGCPVRKRRAPLNPDTNRVHRPLRPSGEQRIAVAEHVTDVGSRRSRVDAAPELSGLDLGPGAFQRRRVDVHRRGRGDGRSRRGVFDYFGCGRPPSGGFARRSQSLAADENDQGGGHRDCDELAALGLPGATPGHVTQRTAPGGSV